jgi:NitT/TauT family transport system substrate-binding protein
LLRRSTRAVHVAAAAALLAAGAAPAGAQTLQTVNVVSTPVDVTGNLYYAIDQGYFKREGLDIEITTIANPALIAQAVAAGTVDVGTTNLVSIVRAIESGIPLYIVAPSGANSVRSPLEGIIVNNSSGIKTAKDLEGKTMVVSVLGSIIQVEALAWADKHGADWRNIKWVESPPASDGALVKSGKVDGSVITETFLSGAIADGDGTLLSYVGSEVSPLLIEGGYFCNADFAKNHPDIVKKFDQALLEAGKWANGHRAEAAAIMQKYSKQTPSAIAHHAVYPESFKAADLQPVIDAAVKYGALKTPISADDVVAPALR